MSGSKMDKKFNAKDFEDVLLPSTQTFYDFSPFLSAPAVQTVARSAGNAPLIISIPTTRVPSPLAPNLAPQTIKDLHDFLCGPANRNNAEHRLHGKEIWLSWKRAWDLWNNHYIEGREAPVWIKAQYEKLKKEFQDERERRRKEEMGRLPRVRHPKTFTSGPFQVVYQDQAPKPRPGRKWVKTGYKQKQLLPTGKTFKSTFQTEGMHFVKETKKTRRLKPGQQMKMYKAGEEVPVVTNPIPLLTESLETKVVRKTPQHVTFPRRLTTWDELCEGRSADVVEQWNTPNQRNRANKQSNLPMKNIENRETINKPEDEDDIIEDTRTELQHVVVRRPVTTMQTVEFETEKKPDTLLTWTKLMESRKNENRIPSPASEDDVPQVVKGQKQVPVQEIEVKLLGTRKTPRDIEGYATVEEIEVEEVSFRSHRRGDEVDEYEEMEVPEWREVPAFVPINRPRHIMHRYAHAVRFAPPDDATSDDDADYSSMSSDSDDDMNDNLGAMIRKSRMSYFDSDRDEPIPIPDHETVKDNNGASGGFLPMKMLPDYVEPEDDGYAFSEWDDTLANTVWRPRRVGEKHLKIDMDLDIEEFFASTDLEVDGGVDCGRSPYPVLRSINKYLREKKGNDVCFVKKKVWDEVTGTIFNMPTWPCDDDTDYEEDDRIIKMETLYGDYFRDEHNKPRHDFFPLDIRRCNRIDTPGRKRKGPSDLLDFDKKGQEEVSYPWRDPVRYYPELKDNDPWWVTPEQERLRDVPPRRYPPKDCRLSLENDGTLLFTDETKWKEERDNDELFHSRYFVTNLHGGTLIINGVEVRKGCIAGPLPDFAVIECPGGQVAFWWGPGGRNWGAWPHHIDFSTRWNTLRSIKGWEHVGLSAGQVWDVLIKDRLRRELTGNRLEDDENWERWKSAEAVEDVIDSTEPTEMSIVELSVYRGDGFTTAGGSQPPPIGEPECFKTEEDELKWLHTRAEVVSKQVDKAIDTAIVWPTPTTYWALDPRQQEAPRPEVILTQIEASHIFDRGKDAILKEQKKYTARYKARLDKKAAQKEAEVARLAKKRRALAFPLPPAKKILTEAEVSAAQKAAGDAAKEALEMGRVLRKDLEDEASKVARRKLHPNQSEKDSNAAWQLEKEAELKVLDEQFERMNKSRSERKLKPFEVKPSEQYRRDQILLVEAKKRRDEAKQAEEKAAKKALDKHRKERNERKGNEEKRKQERDKRADTIQKVIDREAAFTEHDKHRAKRQRTLEVQGHNLKLIKDSMQAEEQRREDDQRMAKFGLEVFQDAASSIPLPSPIMLKPFKTTSNENTSIQTHVAQPAPAGQAAMIQSRTPTVERSPSAPKPLDKSQWDTQEKFNNRDAVDGLNYVLKFGLWKDPGAPKAQQHIAAEERAKSLNLTLEEYLKRNGHASLEAYLKSTLKKETKIPGEFLVDHDERFKKLYEIYWDGFQVACLENGENPQLVARREARNFSPQYTAEKHIRILVEKELSRQAVIPSPNKVGRFAQKIDSVDVAFAKGPEGIEQVIANLPKPGTARVLINRYLRLRYCEV